MSSNAPGFKPVVTPNSRLTGRLVAYLPPLILPDPAKASTSFEGAVLVVEIEGFSALAESLVKLGREGAEALGRSLNNYFGPLIEAINREGGQVINLDGSGLQAFFPAHQPDQLSWTATVALGLLDLAAAYHPVQTAEGRYSFGMRAGIGQGKLEILHLGSAAAGWVLIMQGEALHQARQAVEQAAWGEAVGWPGGPLKPTGHSGPSAQSATPNLTILFGEEDQVSIYNRLAPYLPRVLAQKIKLAPEAPVPAEFRRVVNVFIILPDLDLSQDASMIVLQHYYGTIQRVCSGLDGRVHQIVPGSVANSVSLHLTFGSLNSSSDDAEHALRAALAVRDLPVPSGVLPSISIASGNVYTGSIGTVTCQRYTVLGEAVKLSKQLAQAALEIGSGVLPVDRYTRERVGLSYIFAEELPLILPGQPYPVRINPLLASRPQPCSLASYLKEATFVTTPPADFPVSFDEMLAGKDRVFVLADSGQFYPLAENWLKSGGKGAAGACLPNAASSVPYLAWSGLLGGLIGLNDTDSRTEKAVKLSQVVSRFAPDYVQYSGWLSQLIGLVPEQPGFRSQIGGPQREQFSQFVIELLRGLSQANPLLIIINNLQWSDEPGLFLLGQVVRELGEEPILFCLTLQRGNPAIDSQIDALPGLAG